MCVLHVFCFKGDISCSFSGSYFHFVLVATRIGVCTLMLITKKGIRFLVLSSTASSDWSAQTQLSQQHSLCLWSALLCFQLPVSFSSNMSMGVNYSNVLHGDVVWCHRIAELKAGLLSRRFRRFGSSVFCGRKELLLEIFSSEMILRACEPV